MVRTWRSVRKKIGVPDLISKHQEVVVDPQPVYGSESQLCGVACELSFAPSLQASGKITLAESLEKFISSLHYAKGTTKCAQKVSGLNQHRQIRFAHLSWSLFLNATENQRVLASKVWCRAVGRVWSVFVKG